MYNCLLGGKDNFAAGRGVGRKHVRISQSAVMFTNADSGGGGIYNYGPGTIQVFASNISFNTYDNCEPGGSVPSCFG